jgi:peptidoglycan hydrolase-like protein with peptidoglycan-binding domain
VELLQHALVREGLLPIDAVDGIYGPLTVALVKLFQQRKGLKADGVVGPQTWLALDA